MVGKLFNDLVTALDILPESSTVDICVNHPSPCALAGKVRIIVKRPCVYKSLVLTATGTSRVWMRQGSKTIKAKQVFLKASKEIIFDGSDSHAAVVGGGGVQSSMAIGGGVEGGSEQQQQRRRASSLSSMSSLLNSYPSNNILASSVTEERPLSISASASTAVATEFSVSNTAAEGGLITRSSRVNATTNTPIPQGAAARTQPLDGSNPGSSASNMENDHDHNGPMTHLRRHMSGSSVLSVPPANSANTNNVSSNNRSGTNGFPQNQLRQGVNDIDFYLEFPSHMDSPSTDNNSTTNDSSRSLPSGPFKSSSGDSTIVYNLSATLIMSRRDILVNNQITTSIPFQVQCWQDMIDWRTQNEDHSYHGKRRGKIEFRLQVPKQLDLRRLQDLQFGFEAQWMTLHHKLQIQEVHYAIIEEETQILGPRMAPNIIATVISTTVTHDCTGETSQVNEWTHLRNAARLQIPQPLLVNPSMSTAWSHAVTIQHKLRVTFRFDQSLSKERDLQLSFPISILPTLNAAGGPVHTQVLYRHMARLQSQSRRRARRAMFGMVGFNGEENGTGMVAGDELSDFDEDMDNDDDDEEQDESAGNGSNGSGNRHLPVYADREATLLLMVGHEVVQETTDLLPPEQMDALGISLVRTTSASNISSEYYSGAEGRRTSLLYSPSEASISSGPNSPTVPEQYSWGSAYDNNAIMASSPTSTTGYSMYSTSPDFMTSASGGALLPRRHMSFSSSSVAPIDFPLPPPYVFPSVAEDEEYAVPPSSPHPPGNDHTSVATTTSATTESATATATAAMAIPHTGELTQVGQSSRLSCVGDSLYHKGKERNEDNHHNRRTGDNEDEDTSMVGILGPGRVAPDVGPSSSTVIPPFGLPSPEYELQDSPLDCGHKSKGKSIKYEEGDEQRIDV
ncbi:hypothetical protein FBU30_008954 [Linnemannia zychae]|nr:hypothetical protein FBU30_008954 [Linnemannia zychae]